MSSQKIVLTGSHLTPAIALKEKLQKQDWQVIDLKIDSPKFNRHQPLLSSLSLIKLPYSFIRACRCLAKIKPKLVVSFGGYAALPVCLAAKLLSLPLIIHEQTFAAGLTSRLTSLLANKVAISWPSSQSFFPRKKTILTGNPIRQALLNVQLKKTKTLYIAGGHQGSKTINNVVAKILPALLKIFTVYHQFGLAQSTSAFKQQQQFKHPRYKLKRWFSVTELAQIFSQTSLVISRSGVNTITELAYLHLPAVLIPLETAQKNEQMTNARFLESQGLAIILQSSRLNAVSLLQSIKSALKQLPRQTSLSFDTGLVSSAADNLYQLVKTVIHESKKN